MDIRTLYRSCASELFTVDVTLYCITLRLLRESNTSIFLLPILIRRLVSDINKTEILVVRGVGELSL